MTKEEFRARWPSVPISEYFDYVEEQMKAVVQPRSVVFRPSEPTIPDTKPSVSESSEKHEKP